MHCSHNAIRLAHMLQKTVNWGNAGQRPQGGTMQICIV